MSSCIFTKHGLKTVRWNSKTKKDENYLEPNPAIHINHYCEIEKGTTLKNIMGVVASNPTLSAIVSVYSDVNDIKGFHEEIDRKAKRDTELACLEIYRSGQIYKKDLSIWTDWHGVRKRKDKHGKTVSLSYTALYDIANIPVRLNTEFKVWKSDPKKPDIDYVCNFTMIEILHAIYYDISFHGGPKDRDKVKDELCATAKRILSGEEKTYPFKL